MIDEVHEISVVASHPTGNANFRAVLRSLDSANLLAFGAVGLDTQKICNPLMKRVLPKFTNQLQRRSYENVTSSIRQFPVQEVARLVFQPLMHKLPASIANQLTVDAIYRRFDTWVSKQIDQQSHVYSYEDGSLTTFERAKQLGIKCIYDLPIAYWLHLRQILEREAERMPDWASTFSAGIQDPQEKLDRKTAEAELADVIIVPSRFVEDSLPQRIRGKAKRATFGSPSVLFQTEFQKDSLNRQKRIERGSPLRVLFVGSLTQRKGLADLMMAVNQINRQGSGKRRVELIVMGSLQQTRLFYESRCDGMSYEPGRPHHEVLQLMRTCDVFCLPSLVEGRALVIQEAMSQGIPVIITPNTGAGDVVSFSDDIHLEADVFNDAKFDLIRGDTGFIVPPASANSIFHALEWCLDNRLGVLEMGRCAHLKSTKFTWDAYGTQLIEIVAEVF